jgi:tetratricopeptide (TPR) repeat protein
MSDQPVSRDVIISFAQQSRWDDLAMHTEDGSKTPLHPAEFLFFRGLALTKLGRPAEAVPIIERGLEISKNSRWGHHLLFNARLASQAIEDAFTKYAEFIECGEDLEDEKAWYVERAADLELFDIADRMNLTREVIRSVPPVPKYALAIQCFCKDDTLEKVFEAACALRRAKEFSLIVLQDNPLKSRKQDIYMGPWNSVRGVLNKWTSRLSESFFSVEFISNTVNLGTTPSCKRLIDYALRRHLGFLFIEDDCILAPAALEWTLYHLENMISTSGPWFVTCESSFFDREDREISEEKMSTLGRLAKSDQLRDVYVMNKFVNSTCFATTKEIWNICGSVRSFTRGCDNLSSFVANRSAGTISPVVPLASDIGMLHELGYSVASYGAQKVRELKNTIVLNNEPFRPDRCRKFDGGVDLLYAGTSKLDDRCLLQLEALYGDGSN